MNEITKIHLGRQPFTIAIDAHKALEAYLAAIKRRVGENGKDVVQEVELRMAELLTERKIGPEKVVLLADVEYLKEQLGAPKDFAESDNEKSEKGEDEPDGKSESAAAGKRLFRDTEHGMVAGVAAGLANYMGIDALLVRLGFILVTFLGGWGIAAYIIMWLIVPEASTSSAKLQMKGKPVTVDNLKKVVSRADVPGAARRAGDSVSRGLEGVAKVLLTVLGVCVSLAALFVLFGLTTASMYMLFSGGTLFDGSIFPVGSGEVFMLVVGMLSIGIIALLLLLVGISMVRRKWQVPGWGVASLIGLLFVCLSITGAMAAHTSPKIAERYRASQHSLSIPVQDFTKVHVVGNGMVSYSYKPATAAGIEVQYRRVGDPSKIRTEVKDQTLTVDLTEFVAGRECKSLCLFHDPLVTVEIRSPQLKEVSTEGSGQVFTLRGIKDGALRVEAIGIPVEVQNPVASKVHAERVQQGVFNLVLSGTPSPAFGQYATVFYDMVNVSAQNVEFKVNEECVGTDGKTYFVNGFQTLTVNGKTVTSVKEAVEQYNKEGTSSFNCVGIDGSAYYLYPERYGPAPEVPAFNGSW